MSKTKKSKLLASMLCATVVAGLYAGPVMAGDGSITAGEGTGIKITIDKWHNAGGDINSDPGLFIDHEPLTNEYKVFGNLTITPDQLAAGIKGQDVEFGKVTATSGVIGGVTLDNSTIVAANGNFKVANTGAITAQRGSWIGNAYFGGGYVAVNDGKETEASIGGNHRDGGYLKLNTKDDELVELTGDQLRDIKNGTQNIKYDEVNRQTVIEGATSFDASGMGIESMGGQTTLVGGQATFRDKNGNLTQVMGGTVTASKDVVANGTSLVEVGTAVDDLTDKTDAVEDKTKNIRRIGNATIFSERVGINDRGLSIAADNGDTAIDITKEGNITAVGDIKGDNVYSANYDLETVGYNTQDISYENGKTTVGGVTFNNGFVDASVVKTHSVFFDGGTLSAGGISAVQGKFVVDENGSVKSFGDVQSANYSLENLGENFDKLQTGVDADLSDLKQKTATLTVIEDTPKGTITNISSHLNVQGDISANGDVTTKAGASLNGLNEQVEEDAHKIHDLQVNTAGIKREGEVTTIEGATSFDASGMVIESMNGTTSIVGGQATFSNQNGFTNINGGEIITGDITAETLNGADIDELIASVGTIGETNANVAGIKREGEVTTIEGATSFDANGMVIESMNGTTSIVGGQATFSNQNGFTNINGGEIITGDITAETLNGVDIDELVSGVGTTNKNTAGIERKEVQTIDGPGYATVIEDGTVIGSDGSFSTAFGKLTVEKDGRFSLSSDAWFGGDVNYKYVNKDGSISYGSLQDLTDRVSDLEDKTQNIDSGSTHGPSEPSEGEGPVDNGAHTGINGDVTVGGDANVKGDVNVAGNVNVGDKTQIGNGNISVGEDGNKTTIDNGNITVDNGESGKVEIGNGDVTVTDKDGNEHSIQGNAQDIADIREDMGAMSNRISKVEDRIDKVGAMSAAIANLRTMGYDPAAPTEIAVGIGQYRSETGAALGLFHYPNKDFMLSLSVSTSGDEVMGGIGATWKFGRKTPEQMLADEKEKAVKAKLAKAEAMKKAAAEAKVAAQQAKHAKMAAEKAAK